MEFCPRLPQNKAFDLVERVRGLRMPVFGKRAPRLGAGQKFGFRPGRKVFAARSKIAFSLKESAKSDVQRKRRLLAGPEPARRSSWDQVGGPWLVQRCKAGSRASVV